MSYSPVSVAALGAILAADINQLQENLSHCVRGETAQNIKVAAGTASVTMPGGGGTNTASDSITFASDSGLGDPGFASAPYILIQLTSRSTGDPNIHVVATNKTSSGFLVSIESDDGSDTNTYGFDWIAIGVE